MTDLISTKKEWAKKHNNKKRTYVQIVFNQRNGKIQKSMDLTFTSLMPQLGMETIYFSFKQKQNQDITCNIGKIVTDLSGY